MQSLLERVSLDSLTLRDVRRELRDQLGAKAGEHYQKPWLKELVGELVMRERAGAEGRAEESTGESSTAVPLPPGELATEESTVVAGPPGASCAEVSSESRRNSSSPPSSPSSSYCEEGVCGS